MLHSHIIIIFLRKRLLITQYVLFGENIYSGRERLSQSIIFKFHESGTQNSFSQKRLHNKEMQILKDNNMYAKKEENILFYHS